MSRTVFLDSGPLSLITNPKKTPDTLAVAQWVIAMRAAGHRFIVPAIADYEVRRELIRAVKPRSVAQLDAFNAAESGRFLSVTDNALLLAAQFWAQSRNTGTTVADPKELNADVLIAAQAIDVTTPLPKVSGFCLSSEDDASSRRPKQRLLRKGTRHPVTLAPKGGVPAVILQGEPCKSEC